MVRTCIVPGCKSSAEILCHRFPKLPALSELWTKAIKLQELYNMPSMERTKYRVCHNHFPEDAYVCYTQRRILKKDVVPSLNLPSEQIIEGQNVKIEIDVQSPITNEIDMQLSTDNLEYIPDIPLEQDEKHIEQMLNQAEGMPTRYYADDISLNLQETQDDHVYFVYDANDIEQVQNIEFADDIWISSETECETLPILLENKIEAEENTNYYCIKKDQLKFQLKHMYQSDFINQYDLINTQKVLSNMPRSKVWQQNSQEVLLKPGICKIIRQHLRNKAYTMNWREKYCILIWDNTVLAPHIKYDSLNDIIIGFEDLGNRRSNKFANCALIFMLHGLKSDWRLPIWFGYYENRIKTSQLVKCIKDIVKMVTRGGFRIVATVCKQSPANVAAINFLLRDTQRRKCLVNKHRNIIELYGTKILPFFDPSSLIKAVRNNLLIKDLEINISKNVYHEKQSSYATWKCLELVYIIDTRKNASKRVLPQITDKHIIFDKINKTEVKYATQIFAKNVSAYMQLLSDIIGYIETEIGYLEIPIEGSTATAKVLDFFSNLFDSINGYSEDSDVPLLRSITYNSAHHEFWSSAVTKLRNMRYVEPLSKEPVKKSLCLKNWIQTIRNFQILWKMLRKHGFEQLRARHFHLRPLGKFFECIKEKKYRNPTCTEICAAYKKLLRNSFFWSNSFDEDKIKKNISLKVAFKHCSLCQLTVSKYGAFKREIYRKMRKVVNQYINIMHYQFNIKEKIKTVLEQKFDFNFIYCAEHYKAQKTLIIDFVIITCLNRWCKTVSNMLNGKDTTKNEIPIMKQAQQIYRQTLKRKKNK
nr:PREDICTED: uncharacterized protein LOC105679802 [Linepithema humile]